MSYPRRLRIVAIGGGTGLASVLRGLKSLDCDITAIVTVADDGGSSGRLRKDMGMLPPGDIRNCLLALAEAEPDMTSLFNHRFARGALAGHNFGNLFLAAMTEMTGDFQLAVKTMSRILAVKGRVVPATLSDVTLRADMEDGSVVLGEYAIPQVRKRIRKLSLVPPDPPALDEAVSAIGGADGIIIGPGSLYTSVIPNLLVPGIREAIAASSAKKLYVCNIMTQPGETDGYSVQIMSSPLRSTQAAWLHRFWRTSPRLPRRLRPSMPKKAAFRFDWTWQSWLKEVTRSWRETICLEAIWPGTIHPNWPLPS
ncbi:MAG: gluconeogenesis factor YvcK family protein [Bacillota bacterium]